MKPYGAEQRIVRNRHTDPFKAVEIDGRAYEGLSYLQLDDMRAEGTGLHILKMAPGAAFPLHEHASDELIYVLEGEVIDSDGTCYRPGDMVLLRVGTIHSSHSPRGCTLLFHVESPETLIE